jgi:hypothetical protein
MLEFEQKVGTHVVFKLEDISNGLTPDELAQFGELAGKIAKHRKCLGKEPYPLYLVINKDEPYSKLVYEVIKYGETNGGN